MVNRDGRGPATAEGSTRSIDTLAAAGAGLAALALVTRLAGGLLSPGEVGGAVVGVLALVAPATLRRMGRPPAAGLRALVCLWSASAVLMASQHGGTTAIVLAWLPIGLMVVGMLGDLVMARWLAVADLTAVAALGAASALGLLPPPPPSLPWHSTINVLAMLAAVGGGVMVFVRKRDRERRGRERTQQWFELLATEARVGVLILDRAEVRFANPMARHLFSLGEPPAISSLPAVLLDPEAAADDDLTVLVNGEIRWLEVQRSHLGEREAGLALLTIVDVSDRRSEERARIRAEAESARRQHLSQLGALAGGLAHDLNNLLAAVRTNAEMLRELDEPLLQDEAIGDILAASAQSADIIRQLLAFAGRARTLRTRLDLRDIAVSAARVARSEARRREVQLEVASAGPEVPLEADETELRQVVGNLVTNAVRATEAGGRVRVGVKTLDFDAEALARAQVRGDEVAAGRFAMLVVEDTGCGISEDDLPRIFEPLYTTRPDGRGLGLAAVRGIVERGRGALFVRSSPTAGTRFTVALPAAPEAELADGNEGVSTFDLTPPTPSEPVRARAPAAASQRILVLDDEPLVRTLLVRLLTKAGFRPVAAASLAEAARVVSEKRVDAAVIDFLMPDMTGDVALERLRRVQPELSAVLCSGYISSNRRDVTRQFAAVVSKPFAERELLGAIHTALQASPVR